MADLQRADPPHLKRGSVQPDYSAGSKETVNEVPIIVDNQL